MAQLLKIVVWNANGLCNHAQEIQLFLQNNEIDIMLVSETRFTNKSHIKIQNYSIYNTNHPDGTAHGGTAIIIRNGIKHHELSKYSQEQLQATTIEVTEKINTLKISAVYCPPKHNNKKCDYENFFKTLGNRFIAGGDYNAKNVHWGCRLTTTKGRELLAAMKENNLGYLSTGQPTYWPTDPRKIPDLLDFCVTKGINNRKNNVESSLDLSSDHSPVIITMCSDIQHITKRPFLCSKSTNWELFREKMEDLIDINISLKTTEEIDEAVDKVTKAIQTAARAATAEQERQQKKRKMPYYCKTENIRKKKTKKAMATNKIGNRQEKVQ